MTLGINYKHKLIGVIGFNVIDNSNKKATIGYWLNKSSNGNGIITKSVKALTSYAFNNLGLNRITIKCATKNLKSRAIPEKLGFNLEGIIADNEWLYNHFVDHAQYAMLKENWQAMPEI